MNKEDVFEKELLYIKDDDIKKSTKYMLSILPDYFYVIPASSTGKYHPTFSLGNMGLVRHVKSAVRIAIELFNDKSICNFTSKEKDLILMAIILHDGLKKGKEERKYTCFNHPILMADYLLENEKNIEMSKEDIIIVANLIRKHMGPWTRDFSGKVILEEPTSDMEKFVHLCDYLSSRKFLDITFENNDIIDSTCEK